MDAKEIAQTEDTIEDMKNEAAKLMDENENSNDETPPRKKQKVEEQKIEDRQIDENSSDEEPEEVSFKPMPSMEFEPSRTSEKKKKRRKSKKARVEKTEVEIEAPLDDAIFAAMEEDETVEKIQFENKQKMNRQEERKKRVFEMPTDPGSHLVKQKKIKTVSAASSSAMAFLEQMRGRHVRVSKDERKRNFEKIKFNKNKQ